MKKMKAIYNTSSKTNYPKRIYVQKMSAYLDMYIKSFNLNYRHWNFNKVGGGFGIRGRISNIIKYSNRIKPFHIRNSNKTYTKISYKSKFTDDLESLSIKRYL